MKNETYIAIILYKGSSTSSDFIAVFEEMTLFIKAISSEDAEKQAEHYGKNNQPQYKNDTGDQIKWTFMSVESINLILEEITSDVTPIHSRYFHNMDAYSKFRELVD